MAETYPRKYELTKSLWLNIGYQDGHVDVVYTGLIKAFTLRIDPHEVPLVDDVLKAEVSWLKTGGLKPMKHPMQFKVSDDATALVGFPDMRVDIQVKTKLPWPLPQTATISVPAKSVPIAIAAITAEKNWLSMPEMERFRLGAV